MPHRVEPSRDVLRVPDWPARLALSLADERLRVDDEPALALRAEDVAAVEVLVHEPRRRPVDRSVDVEGRVEKGTLERRTCGCKPARDVLQPPVGFDGEQGERMVVLDAQL